MGTVLGARGPRKVRMVVLKSVRGILEFNDFLTDFLVPRAALTIRRLDGDENACWCLRSGSPAYLR
jgi:hypothetical protein